MMASLENLLDLLTMETPLRAMIRWQHMLLVFISKAFADHFPKCWHFSPQVILRLKLDIVRNVYSIYNLFAATAKSYHLTSVFWDSLSLVERFGFKLMCVCADGATNNRKFFCNLVDGFDTHYKLRNPFSQDRFIYLWPDPPHLIKVNILTDYFFNIYLYISYIQTARNSMLKNTLKSPTGEIQWKHMEVIYKELWSSDLHQPSKLKHSHIYLNSRSKMSVKYAAQV